MWGDFHEHMDMFSRQNAGYDLDAQFSAHLPDNRSNPLPQRAFQHLVAILAQVLLMGASPHYVVPTIRVLAIVVQLLAGPHAVNGGLIHRIVHGE